MFVPNAISRQAASAFRADGAHSDRTGPRGTLNADFLAVGTDAGGERRGP
jgi:hypothetical protein